MWMIAWSSAAFGSNEIEVVPVDLALTWKRSETAPVTLLNTMRDQGLSDAAFIALGRRMLAGDPNVWAEAGKETVIRAAIANGYWPDSCEGTLCKFVSIESIEVLRYDSALDGGEVVLVHMVMPADPRGTYRGMTRGNVVALEPGLTEPSALAHELGHVIFAKRFPDLMNGKPGRYLRINGTLRLPSLLPSLHLPLLSCSHLSELFAVGAELQNPFGYGDDDETLQQTVRGNPGNSYGPPLLSLLAPMPREDAGRLFSGAALSIGASIGADPGQNDDERLCSEGKYERCAAAGERFWTSTHPAALARAANAAASGCLAGQEPACAVIARINKAYRSSAAVAEDSAALTAGIEHLRELFKEIAAQGAAEKMRKANTTPAPESEDTAR
ncbi:MAG: hypothetical protein ABMA64_02700 [Myxococcota bacterium]